MPTTFPLLDAPPEIRQKIYHHLLYSAQPISLNSPTAHTHYPLSLLQTCLQIYQEVRPLYFSINTFCISVHKHNPDWEYILGPGNDDGKGIDDREREINNSGILWQDRRRLIRTLRLNVVRWGSKDFFCARLMPALEDMVLNGSLRVLEVWLREDHLIKSYLGGVEGQNGTWKEQRPLERLKRLLEDPYLERAKLWACVQNPWDPAARDVSSLLKGR